MYDVGTQLVNRLKGELSNAFVDVAESNAKAQGEDDDDAEVTMSLSDSGILEKMPTIDAPNDRITIVEANSALPSNSNRRISEESQHDSRTNQAETPTISISSGYSVIKR